MRGAEESLLLLGGLLSLVPVSLDVHLQKYILRIEVHSMRITCMHACTYCNVMSCKVMLCIVMYACMHVVASHVKERKEGILLSNFDTDLCFPRMDSHFSCVHARRRHPNRTQRPASRSRSKCMHGCMHACMHGCIDV